MKSIYLIISSILIIFFALTACEDKGGINSIDDIDIPLENVSFAEHLFPIFQAVCATSECHDDNSRAGGYSVTNYPNVTQPGIVNPGSPETSRLIWSIYWDQYGFTPMPPPLSGYLSEERKEGIWTWIEEGAKNN